MAWIVRIGLPLLGAAAVLATLEAAGGDLRRWPASTAALILGAETAGPAVAVGLTARRESAAEVVLWTLLALAAVVVLVFGVGIGLLGYGPR